MITLSAIIVLYCIIGNIIFYIKFKHLNSFEYGTNIWIFLLAISNILTFFDTLVLMIAFLP